MSWRRNLKHLIKWLLYAFGLCMLMLAALMLYVGIQTATAMVRHSNLSEAKTAHKICAAIGGENAWFKYGDKGQLICTNKRGDRLKTQP